MGITNRSRKHANCQHDSLSNYRIIQCKLLGDNNNNSGLIHLSAVRADMPTSYLFIFKAWSANVKQTKEL